MRQAAGISRRPFDVKCKCREQLASETHPLSMIVQDAQRRRGSAACVALMRSLTAPPRQEGGFSTIGIHTLHGM